MAAHAAELFAPGTRALTHCNAGGLATGGYGSAVGAFRAAWERGLLERVLVDETRPLLQGARLTAWELETRRHPARVIADSAAASMMARGEVDLVITGADRIAANGDTANKIGTYGLAVLAATTTSRSSSSRRRRRSTSRRRPAPRSRSRSATRREVTTRFAARNPAFDVTPAALIAAIVTEAGVHRAPYAKSLAAMKALILAAGYATRLRPLTDRSEGAAAARGAADRRHDPRQDRAAPRSTRSTS